MKDIKNIHLLVEQELEVNKAARNSDITLYLAICQRMNPLSVHMEFETVFNNLKQLGIPKFETVSRCRRKVQEQNPLLRADKEVEDGRYENYKICKEYAGQ